MFFLTLTLLIHACSGAKAPLKKLLNFTIINNNNKKTDSVLYLVKETFSGQQYSALLAGYDFLFDFIIERNCSMQGRVFQSIAVSLRLSQLVLVPQHPTATTCDR